MPPGARCALAALLILIAPGAARAGTSPDAALVEALRAALSATDVSCSESHLKPWTLASYYQPANPRPLWVSNQGPGARARTLRAALRTAGQDGLEPARYRLAEIETLWRDRSPTGQACLELNLTNAFARYSRDLRTGEVGPHEADPSWYIPAAHFDPVAALAAVRNDADFAALIEGLAPSHRAYRRLRDALARYESIARAGGWPMLPPGPKLAPSDASARAANAADGGQPAAPPPAQVVRLRARLRAEGDLSGSSRGNRGTYDAALATAVRRFQRRHGLHDDGIVGVRTRAALNVPAEARIAQIRRTLERWRWLPRDLGDHYILVNSAGFELAVFEHGRTVLGMRVIVGAPDQATPSFSATLRSLVINPYWNVPERIARDALLPRQQRDPRYFVTRGFRVFDLRGGREIDPARVNWKRVDAGSFGFRLRQEPGPKNSMGRLTFVFPNPFDVFLHDTPEKWLFKRDTRTFSEGCVRIEHAVALAQHTLRRLDGWSKERIRSEIDTLHHETLPLPEPIPVYVLYLTTWVDDDGLVNFREDVYGREQVLAWYYPAR